ncbi:uncharacterized protein RHO25_002975 [Cercospora beticola]|uniref:WSC domain-containing protein n=1 Tax=Cercospora beticola TaxID=122368 RepID=A0ABZ0NFP7_CERBT|nr:hypothetical protein RHO25_002975 [Cercospora beticola]CAK1359604.1 unnamed protein product [Cercospora beticola]
MHTFSIIAAAFALGAAALDSPTAPASRCEKKCRQKFPGGKPLDRCLKDCQLALLPVWPHPPLALETAALESTTMPISECDKKCRDRFTGDKRLRGCLKYCSGGPPLALEAAALDSTTTPTGSCEKRCRDWFADGSILDSCLNYCKSASSTLAVREARPATVTVIETLIYHETICPTTPQECIIAPKTQSTSQISPSQKSSSQSSEPPVFPTYPTSRASSAETSPSAATTSSQPTPAPTTAKSTAVPIQSTEVPTSRSSKPNNDSPKSTTESSSNAEKTPEPTPAEERPQESQPAVATGGAFVHGASFGVILMAVGGAML